MSDYISKSALIEALNKEEKEFEDCVLMPTWYSALSVFHNQPTISETEIIRKTFERVVERLEELQKMFLCGEKSTEHCQNKDDCIGKSCFVCIMDTAIEIVKEECGISE